MLVNRAKVFVSNYQLVGISWNIEQGDGGYCGETLGLHGHIGGSFVMGWNGSTMLIMSGQ